MAQRIVSFGVGGFVETFDGERWRTRSWRFLSDGTRWTVYYVSGRV